jgi:hypothetical protein
MSDVEHRGTDVTACGPVIKPMLTVQDKDVSGRCLPRLTLASSERASVADERYVAAAT